MLQLTEPLSQGSSGSLWILEATNTLFKHASPTLPTQKAANSEWGPEQDMALQQVQATRQAILLLGIYNLTHVVVLGSVCPIQTQNGDSNRPLQETHRAELRQPGRTVVKE